MKTLQALGKAQNRKVYARQAPGVESFGVSFADLEKLKKTIKTDPQLAAALWITGNFDARNLATLIADPAQMRERDLDAWVGQIACYLHGDLFARHVASQSPLAGPKAEAWRKSGNDFIGQVGWGLTGMLAMNDGDRPDSYFEKCLQTIERGIHKSKNRTRHAMNGALIGIGLRNARLQKLALAAARRIGKVEVDHGKTNRKTPDAASYIKKAAAWKKKKGR